MTLQSFSILIEARQHSVNRRIICSIYIVALTVLIFCLVAVAGCAAKNFASQWDAPGNPVVIPGIDISGWGKVSKVKAHFGLPADSKPKAPAVLILHGSGGVDGRGAFYAKALQQAGIATLEITMFPPGGRPREGPKATIPHAAAALKWLAAQSNVDSHRLGVMGFSWGGYMSLMMSNEFVQEQMGKDVPKPIAFAPFYPVCTSLISFANNPKYAYYNTQTRMRMSGAPKLIHVGTRDDYEEGERPCAPLLAMWPSAAREHTTVRYVEGATHAFDTQRPARFFYDKLAHDGRGAIISVTPSPKDAAEARQEVVNFFVKYLNPQR
jgi:dienelactone hydrolase